MKKTIFVFLISISILLTGCVGQETIVNDEIECTNENQPIIFHGKGGNILEFCGDDTRLIGHEFKEEKFVLYIEKKENEREYVVKTVATESPYTQELLIDAKGSAPNMDDVYVSGNHYVFSWTGDAPGYMRHIFIFNPKTKDFILAEDSFWNPIQKIYVYSSNSNNNFIAELNTEDFIGGDYSLQEDGHEKGAATHRFKAVAIDKSKGTAAK